MCSCIRIANGSSCTLRNFAYPSNLAIPYPRSLASARWLGMNCAMDIATVLVWENRRLFIPLSHALPSLWLLQSFLFQKWNEWSEEMALNVIDPAGSLTNPHRLVLNLHLQP